MDVRAWWWRGAGRRPRGRVRESGREGVVVARRRAAAEGRRQSGRTYSFWSSAVAAATMDGRDEGFDRRFLVGSSGWFSTEVSFANKLNMLTVDYDEPRSDDLTKPQINGSRPHWLTDDD